MNKSVSRTMEDRRRFFRIDDEINIFYQIVDEQVVIAASQEDDDILSTCSLLTALDVLDQECHLIMYRIEKKEPEIAEYLKILDSKIDLLAQATMRQSNELAESNMCNANISASGLAFESKNSIKEGEFLEIKLLLASALAAIVIYGKVIYCKKIAEENDIMPYQIGVDFINLKEQDRELLIKHVVKRQMQQIREKKGF